MYILYDLAHALYYILFKLFFRYRVIGRENVPRKGPVILASNHASYLDPPLVGTGIWRRVNFVAKEELFRSPWKNYLLTRWKAIPVRREQMDMAALKAIMERLKAGEAVALFPEGTRSQDENLLPGKPGIGMIVSMSEAPVVPVYIKGSWRTLGKASKTLRPVPITVFYGKPILFPRTQGEERRERYQRISDAIMAEIDRLKRGTG